MNEKNVLHIEQRLIKNYKKKHILFYYRHSFIKFSYILCIIWQNFYLLE